ncbi:YD repeat-containing protein [Chryseobacterium ginsenosidimutans]|uniref:RHS repeat protein n=1 Tax=Chryseobacterium ginsenosidimutans TaxID=687846 RepID=UPI002788680F|nr:RHS repeat domain-containing protein [Chryseobacterium ginsenosidimutans]MDQ0593931.1 YD repeat-containing protein [Chryseobacterium ginsenosidimutans]
MKKNYKAFTQYIMAILLLLISNTILQAQGNGFEIQKDSYNKTPEGNIANGLPSIGFPLLTVPTNSPKLSFNFGIDYNANRTSNQNLPGDVGKGWSLSSDYSIVRVSHAYPVDYVLNNSGAFFTNISDGNAFQYSIPGESAKFTINYDKTTHKYVGISENGFKNKILIEKNTTDTLIYKIKSFTVIDAKGLKYIFDKPDISYYRGINDNMYVQKNFVELYHDAFHITKILDSKDNILATFEYITTTRNVNDTRGTYETSQSKISNILIPNVGSISFTYPPSPQKIILKDTSGNIIKQVLFDRDGGNYLNSLSLLDKNNIKQEEYLFEYNGNSDNLGYDQYGFPNNLSNCSNIELERFFNPASPNPEASTIGLLKTVYLPTGGRTEYEYESNTISSETGSSGLGYIGLPGYYDQYKTDLLYDEDFAKGQLSQPLNLNIDPVKYQIFFIFADGVTYYKNTDQIDHLSVTYSVTDGVTNTPMEQFVSHWGDYGWIPCGDLKWFGTNNSSVKLNFVGKSSGHFKVYAIRTAKEPFIYTEGVRIKNIKKYEGENSSMPTENLNYNYHYFDNPTVPSSEDYGTITYTHPTNGIDKYLRQLVYKNVTVTDAVKNFSTRYTFLLPSEVLTQTSQSMTTLLDYGSPYSTGLPTKIQQYTGNNQLVSEKNIQYTFAYKTIADKYLVPSDFKYPLLQKQTVTEKMYRENNTVLTTSSEKVYEPLFSNLISEKSTDFSGETIEAAYKYASEVQNQNLLSANKIATPVIIETKSTRSGLTTPLSKTENLYMTANSSEPSGVLSYDPVSGAPSTETTIDKYDVYGNVIQATGKDGMTNCIIYGYHGTLPIAKISGITYDALQSQGILSSMIAASDADADNPANESQLINALNIFRRSDALKNLPVATFTYDPLVGVTSETDASGIKKVYQYDNANRLIKILDAAGNTLQEFKTHFKGQ